MKTKSLFIIILIALTSCKSQIASQEPITPDTNPWGYYCRNYLHIDPHDATSEQENYYLDVFMETDEYYNLFIIPFETED